MSNNVKTVKRGEFLFKEGDKITSIMAIQTGAASLCLARQKKVIDIFPVGPNQIVGEMAFSGATTYPVSCIATQEVKYMELPIDFAKSQVEAAPQFLKVVIKSLLDRMKLAINDLKTTKMEKDASPCSEDQVAKVFGSIYHTASHKGEKADEKNKNKITLDWTQLKQYNQRIFGESPRRTEQAAHLLVKIKLAEFEMGKSIDDPDGPDEIQKIHFLDLPALEAFFEFYQYYYFKGGNAQILKYDEQAFNLLSCFLKLSETVEPDRFGVVAMDFSKVVEAFKTEFNITLNNNHFTLLEGKGVYAKRQARTDGPVVLQFELKEWKTTQKIWRIVREIERWNERGFIDMKEEENLPKKKPGAPSCPQCSAEVAPQAKFCAECGHKLGGGGGEQKPAA